MKNSIKKLTKQKMNPIISKLSLRQRLTLLVAIMLALIALTLMGLGIFNSHRHFESPILMAKIVNQSIPAVTLLPVESQLMPKENFEAKIESTSTETIPVANQLAVATTISQAQRGFSQSIFFVTMAIIFAGIILTYFVVGRALRPLTRLSTTISTIGEHNLSERLVFVSTDDEVASLTGSFNTMLARLENSFDIQKRFSANVAHELKTPLATIKTSLQVLALDDQPSVAEYQENAQVVGENVDRLIEIVNNLLLLADSQNEPKERIDLHQVAQLCLQDVTKNINQKNLNLSTKIEPCLVLGNQALLVSMLQNLLDNAIKYSHAGGKITLSISQVGSRAEICLQDEGVGISPACLEHIFEPFYRADQSRSKNITGNGLGLAIVKAIVAKHQGEIYFSSQPNQGTRVLVSLVAFTD